MTFATFLTPEGIVAAAALVTSLISVLRTAIPFVATVDGRLLALVLSAVLYVLTAISVGIPTPDAALTLFAAWLACATASVGAYETVTKPVVERMA